MKLVLIIVYVNVFAGKMRFHQLRKAKWLTKPTNKNQTISVTKNICIFPYKFNEINPLK